VDEKTGAVIEEEDITDGGTTQGGETGGGSTDPTPDPDGGSNSDE